MTLSTDKGKGKFPLYVNGPLAGTLGKVVSLAIVQKRYNGPQSSKVMDKWHFKHINWPNIFIKTNESCPYYVY